MEKREQHIGGLIKRLSDRMRTRADANLKNQGITFQQCRVLRYLDDRGGSASQKEIEDHLQVSHPTVVGIVARLEKNGFVACHSQAEDRRVKMVGTTPKARALRESMCHDWRTTEDRMLRDFTPEEKEALLRLLLRMYRNMEEKEEGRRDV